MGFRAYETTTGRGEWTEADANAELLFRAEIVAVCRP
jgi:hypothetical protein